MRRVATALLAAGALFAAGCGDTVQSAPLGRSSLESLLLAKFPVYWAGHELDGLQARELLVDPGGAVTLQYGNCLEGGQGTCVAPLRIVTSPNNSFVPGGAGPIHDVTLRGTTAHTLDGGSTIVIPAGRVVLSIYATSRALADAAAGAVVPVANVGAYHRPLPAPAPATGLADEPLPGQIPPYQPAAHHRRVERRRARR
ncbi:MAG TPA: hypothetical protein VMA83_06980 [Solirubrobacteraceae bacterium]|nr:hypothetical protein [Solirubrobacteraceae bacterium]